MLQAALKTLDMQGVSSTMPSCGFVVLFFSIDFAHYFPIASSCIMSCFVKSRAIFSSDHSWRALLAFMLKRVSTTSQCAVVCWAHSCHCIPPHS